MEVDYETERGINFKIAIVCHDLTFSLVLNVRMENVFASIYLL